MSPLGGLIVMVIGCIAPWVVVLPGSGQRR
jgi:hypothetical protein